MPEIKDDFRPDKLTSAQMDTVVSDVKEYIFTNWENKENPDFSGVNGIATKFALRLIIKDAMKGRAKEGLAKKLKKRGWTGVAAFNPKDFTEEESGNIQAGLKKHLVDNWDDFSNVTRKNVKAMSKKAVAIGDKERSEKKELASNQKP